MTFEARWVERVSHWVLFEDGQETDCWVLGLTREANDEMIAFAVNASFVLDENDRLTIRREKI